jgi:DNA-binding transcriptional LysR family regulator
MTDLNELSIFVRVAQVGSFTAAARALGMPVSTVSRKVSELEARLGLSLIKRTTRRLSLSEQGLGLFERCAPHLQGLEEAEAVLTGARGEPEGVVHVTAPVSLGRGEFVDLVSRVLAKYPKLQIDLQMTNDYVDLVTTPVDVAIRFGALADSSVIAKRLGSSYRLLVASPDYLKRHGSPKTPADLARHECICFSGRTATREWVLQHGKRRLRVRVEGRASANNLESVNELALRGHGVALLPEPYLVTAAATGALRRVLPGWTSLPIAVHAVFLNRKFVPAKVQAFLTELTSWENSTWRKP